MSRCVATLVSCLAVSWTAVAAASASGADLPRCYDRDHQVLDLNNEQVLDWEQSTPNQYLARGHIRGQIVRLYSDRNGHTHFSAQIGATSRDTIEVVYSQDFGDLPRLQLGSDVEACGDYITSNAATGRYQASPDGAIIHWIHRSDSDRHESGYLAIDGEVYGY